MIALIGFYIALTGAMYGHLGAIHGAGASFLAVLRANRIWFAAAAISGPVMGAMGSVLGRLRWMWATCLPVVSLLLCEGPAVALVAHIPSLGWGPPSSWLVYELEAALGIAFGFFVITRRATHSGLQ